MNIRNNLLTIIAMIIVQLACAQSDSLWQIYTDKSLPDSTRLRAIGDMGWYMTTKNADSCIVLGRMHLQLAQKLRNEFHIGKAYNTLGVGYFMTGQSDSAIANHQKSLESKLKIHDTTGAGYSYGNLANVYFKTGKWDQSIKHYEKACELFGTIGNTEMKIQAMIQLGVVYSKQGNIPMALELMNEGLTVAEEAHDTTRILSALNAIANIYKDQEELGAAMQYHQRAYEMGIAAGNRNAESNALANIAGIHEMNKNYPAALEYYERARVIKEELGRKSDVASIISSTGNVYLSMGDTTTALEKLNSALEMQERMNEKVRMATTLRHIGSIYFYQGKYALALTYLERALTVAQKSGAVNEISSSSRMLFLAYKRMGNFPKALSMYELHITMRDSMDNEVNGRAVVKNQYRYEYEKQALADSLSFANEKALSDLQFQTRLEQERLMRYSLFAGLGLISIIGGLAFRGYRRKRRDNLVILEQKQEVENQKKIVDQKNKEVLDSITYAKRIQKAILPPASRVKECLPDAFIYYAPKDIVAGDFYWVERHNDLVIFAAADCTGHGVPGAMVSLVCNNAVNRSVREFGLTDPGKILDKTREIVIREFEQSEEEVKDGMDISLCALNTRTRTLHWAGANNPVWIIRNGELLECKADKQPVGVHLAPQPFRTHTFELSEGDLIYVFTDGYSDQFGGPDGKKFKSARLKQLLVETHRAPVEQQKIKLENEFASWKGALEQIDDVCVIGVKVQ